MGGALTAVADSFDAMLYNPAGLVQSEESRVELSYWQEESKDNDVIDGSNFFSELDGLAGTSEAEVDVFLQREGIKAQSARTQTFAGYHNGTGFGIGIIDTTRLSSPASPSAPTQLDLTYDNITGGLLTLSYASDSKFLMWGITLKSLQRDSSNRILSAADIGADSNFRAEFGTKGDNETDFDLGLLVRLPIPFLRPTFGVAVMNASSPDFNRVTVQPLKRETNIGLALEPDMFREYIKLIISAEIRDNSSSAFPEEKENRKREHLGAELSFLPYDKDIFWMHVRIGKSQGFSTFGIGVNFSRFATIDVVSYAEDVGDPGVEIRQRRQLVQLKIGF